MDLKLNSSCTLLVLAVGLALKARASGIPFEGSFSGEKAIYLRRVTHSSDWHPTQLIYEDGAEFDGDSRVVGARIKLDDVSKEQTTTVSPADFGADPYGVRDSSEAFRLAIDKLRLLCKPKLSTLTYQHIERSEFDCGGAVLALRGGMYLVSEPVRIPAGLGNLWVKGGTIVASKDFYPTVSEDPTGVESFLLIFGHNCTQHWQDLGACASNVGVQQLTLDAKKKAGGCLYVNHIGEATVGPGIMILGFSTFGITAFGSGGTIMQGIFAGEYPYNDSRFKTLDELNGTAIYLAHPQHDGYVMNSIIWSAKVGLVTHGSWNHITGVHPWNCVFDPIDGHKTSAVDGAGLGIVVSDGSARIEDCYIDNVPLVLNMNINESTLVTGNLFQRNASIIISAPRSEDGTLTDVNGLVITDNIFRCDSKTMPVKFCQRQAVILDETSNRFGSVYDTRVEGNTAYAEVGYRSTKARKSVAANGERSVTLDFSSDLLFPAAALSEGSVSCGLRGKVAMAHTVDTDADSPMQVRVIFAEKWTGVVECIVDQSISTRCAQ